MTETLQLVQTIFYSMGCLALGLGSVLAVRRYLGEGPDESVLHSDPARDDFRVVPLNDNELLYVCVINITGASRTKQWIEEVHYRVLFPDDADWPNQRKVCSTIAEVRALDWRLTPMEHSRRLGKGEVNRVVVRTRVGAGRPLFEVIRIQYHVCYRRARQIRPGYHADFRVEGGGATLVIDSNDREAVRQREARIRSGITAPTFGRRIRTLLARD